MSMPIFSARYTKMSQGERCPSKQQEIDAMSGRECKMAGEGLGLKWNDTTGRDKWTGPGSYSVCLATESENKSVILNPKPFKTEINLEHSAICRTAGDKLTL